MLGRWLLGVVVFLAGCAGEAKREGPPPIVLISLDTFRADRVGALGNADGLTPNIDAFAAESVVFDNAYSQAVQTTPSHASMFTSRYPSEQVGLSDSQPHVPKEMPLLAQLMSLYGYHTGAFVGGADLSEYRGLNLGFDEYESPMEFGSLYHTGPLALGWLETLDDDRPYFLFVHGYDTHSPYVKPPPYGYAYSDARLTGTGQDAVRTATERIVDGKVYADFTALMGSYEHALRPRSEEGKAYIREVGERGLGATPVPVTDEDLALIRDVYDGAVSYADTMFGLFLAALQERGVLDEAVVVLMADHGEQLGENGIFGHCCEANDEESHVPLMIRLPGGEGGGRRVSGFVELVDLMPTLLEVAGATPPAHIHGHSLLPAVRGEPFEGRAYAFTEGSELMRLVTMRGPKGRLTYSGLSPSARELPDIVEAARLDGPGFIPSEGLDVAEQRAMRGALTTWLRELSPPPPQGSGKRKAMPDALKKSLREHGYWDVQE